MTADIKLQNASRPMNADRNFVVALARGLDVLACFGPRATSLNLTEIATRSKLPKATVARITYTLMELAYMRQDPGTRKYSLGPAVLSLGNPVLASLPIRQIAQPVMRHLAESVGGTVSLGVLDGDRIVYVETSRSVPDPVHIPDIGSIWPILESGIGRAVLAAMSSPARTRMLNRIKVNEPVRWEQQRPKVEEALRDYARYGYCVSLEGLRPGIVGVGVPLPVSYLGYRLAFNCAIVMADPTDAVLREQVAPELVKMVSTVQRLLDTEKRRLEATENQAPMWRCE